MNVANESVFHALKPVILSIRKTETLNVFVVGPLKINSQSQNFRTRFADCAKECYLISY